MLVRRKASHSPRSSVKMRGDSPDNGELASLYRINDSSRHSSIAFRPAAVIWRRTASTGLAPAFTVSRSAVASPARTRPATMSLSNPWARTSSASVAPCGLLASSFGSSSVRRGCGLRRRFRMVVIHPLSAASYVGSIGRRAVGLLGHEDQVGLRPRPSGAIAAQWDLCLLRVPHDVEGRLRLPSTDRPPMSFRCGPLLRKLSLWTDPPDHARLRDLNQRAIARNNEFGVWIRLAEVAHRAVINDPGAAIRAELDVRRTIEPAGAAHERLFKCVVVGKPHDLERKRFLLPAEVDEFDLVSGFRRPIRPGKAEVALKRIQRRATLHRSAGKGIRHEVDAGKR